MTASVHVPALRATLIGSDAIEHTWRLLATSADRLTRNGKSAPLWLLEAVEATRLGAEAARLEAPTRSDVGRLSGERIADSRPSADIAAESKRDQITTDDLAADLHVTARHALRMAQSCGLVSNRVGRSHLWPADAATQITQARRTA